MTLMDCKADQNMQAAEKMMENNENDYELNKYNRFDIGCLC